MGSAVESIGAPAAPARTRSRWRRLALVLAWVLASAAIAAGIAFWIYFSHYQPIGGSNTFGTQHAELVRITADGEDMDSFFETTLVRYVPGSWFAVMGTMPNDGRFPIRVDRIFRGVQGGAYGLREVRFGPSLEEARATSLRVDEYEAFEPFTLEAGENRLYVAIYDFKDAACRHPAGSGGGYFSINSFDVEFEVFGVTRRAPVVLGNEVWARTPTPAECSA